ncbi:MAG: PucR family transcriptional regulator ligand-binding domain-containing protein [Synergistaceae bacterium]
MATTVRDVLVLENFNDFVVLAGQGGLGKEITATTFMEAPDSWKWIRGGEFVITLAYAFQTEEKLLELLNALIDKNATCLGLKTDRYIKTVPQSILDLADEKDFPIIHIPNYFPFADIIHPVQALVLQDQARLLKYSEKVRHTFFDLNVGAATIDEILQTLQEFVHYSLMFVDITTDEKHILCDTTSSLPKDAETDTLPILLSKYPSEDISSEGRVIGYLIFDTQEKNLTDKWREIPINQAKGSLLLYLQRRNAQSQVEARYRNEFVFDIISNNIRMEKEVWNRARTFSWDMGGAQVVVVFDIDNYKKRLTLSIEEGKGATLLEYMKTRIYSIVKLFMSSIERGFKYPYTELSDSIVYILPASVAQDGKNISVKLQQVIDNAMKKITEETKFTVTVGVGAVSDNIFSCYNSYEQAREGLELLRKDTGGNIVAKWSDMGLYKLLHTVRDSEVAKDFIESQFASLLKQDASGMLLSTLFNIIDNNWNIKQTAGVMNLHYNTLKYRSAKLWEILSIDPSLSEDRLKLMIAVKLYKLDWVLRNTR